MYLICLRYRNPASRRHSPRPSARAADSSTSFVPNAPLGKILFQIATHECNKPRVASILRRDQRDELCVRGWFDGLFVGKTRVRSWYGFGCLHKRLTA